MPGKIEPGRNSHHTDRNRPGKRPPPRLIHPNNDARHTVSLPNLLSTSTIFNKIADRHII